MNTFGHLRRAIMLAVLVALAATGCGSAGGSAPSTTSAPGQTAAGSPDAGTTEDSGTSATGQAWRLVVLSNQSGPFSPSGRDAIQGVRLRVQEINDAGGVLGRPIEIQLEDAATDVTRATQLAEGVQAGDDLLGVIGPEGAGTSLAVKPVLADKGILQYANTGFWIPGQDGQPGDFSPLYFATHGPTLYGGGTSAFAWLEQQGHETLGLIRSSDASGDLYSQLAHMGDEANDAVELIGEEVFDVDAPDVSTAVSNIANLNPDAIYVGTTGPGLATVLQGIQDLGIDVPVWAGWGSTTSAVADLVKDRLPAAGLYSYGEAVHVWDELPDDHPQKERLAELEPSWNETFGNGPTFDGAAAYDQVSILAMALEAVGSADHQEMATWMEDEMGEYVGAAYTYDFASDDHRGIEGSGLIVEFTQDGGFTLAGTIEE